MSSPDAPRDRFLEQRVSDHLRAIQGHLEPIERISFLPERHELCRLTGCRDVNELREWLQKKKIMSEQPEKPDIQALCLIYLDDPTNGAFRDLYNAAWDEGATLPDPEDLQALQGHVERYRGAVESLAGDTTAQAAGEMWLQMECMWRICRKITGVPRSFYEHLGLESEQSLVDRVIYPEKG